MQKTNPSVTNDEDVHSNRVTEIKRCLLYLNRLSAKVKDVFCDPCLCGNIKTIAKKFCKTCDEPEPMCEACAQLHTRQKATRHHEIDSDLHKLYIRDEKIDRK